MQYPAPVAKLIAAFRKLPSIGPRSAERLALYLIDGRDEVAAALETAISEARRSVRPCKRCGFIAEGELCRICASPDRDNSLVCVVEHVGDLILFEKSGEFKGLYHVLGGLLSPLDGIGPEELEIPRMIARFESEGVKEVILGLPSDVRGETTHLYLAGSLKRSGIRATRLATGISAGGALEFVDPLTLRLALQDRREVTG